LAFFPIVTLAAPAQGLLDRAKRGVSDAADVLGKGAESVGSALETGAGKVEDSIRSTNELIFDVETPQQTRQARPHGR
jgi:hypothetical protein